MILQRLVDYAGRTGLGAEESLSLRVVHWRVDLDADGRFLGVVALGREGKRHGGRQFQLPYTPPALLNGGKISHFLVDSSQRALLWLEPDDEVKRRKWETQHAYFWSLIEQCRVEASEPTERALAAALRARDAKGEIARRLKSEGAKHTQSVAFAVADEWLHDMAGIAAFWKSRQSAASKSAVSGLDMTSGDFAANILASHGTVKGVRGGQISGVRLVSNDKAAFQSFGLEDARNAPVSAASEAKYRSALNELVRHGKALPGANLCFWTRSGAAFDPWDIVGEASAEAVRALFDAPATGRPGAAALDADGFYALALSGVGGRIMVRGWLDTTVGGVKENIKRWFDDISMIASDGGIVVREHKLYALLYALARADDLDALPPQLASDLWDCAVQGVKPSAYILRLLLRREALDRCSGDKIKDAQGRSMRRMALARLCLRRLGPGEGRDMTVSLEAGNADPAYVCGRIMAVLDRLQHLASGGVGAGIIERAYGAASVTPSLVFGRLMRLAQTHLSKLHKTKPGAAVNVEKELEELATRLGSRWPQSLSLADQGRFALGFYHQKAEYRRRKEALEPQETTEAA
ncbi:MAG: type I-C CRISPR-associated protein Cas8c/Csd1 [Elusimicrobia bacterium]|nr:type I-C CRISPR-associated protein Cas8c/Csd1 [Elusimicrobiota bacterium]